MAQLILCAGLAAVLVLRKYFAIPLDSYVLKRFLNSYVQTASSYIFPLPLETKQQKIPRPVRFSNAS
jgi:hypothetical protein